MTTLQQYVDVLAASGTLFWDGQGNPPKDRFIRLALASLTNGAIGVLLTADTDQNLWAVASGVQLALSGSVGQLTAPQTGISMALTFARERASGTLIMPLYTNSGAMSGSVQFEVVLQQLTGTPGYPPTAPEAAPQTYSTATGVTLRVAAASGVLSGVTDTNAGAAPFTANLFVPPAAGTLTLNPNGSFTYVPNTKFAGLDTFTFTAKDSNGLISAVSLATIQVGFLVVPKQMPPSGPGATYKAQLKAVGGTEPYTWSLATPLPKGLKLSSSGLVSGTAGTGLTSGSHSFTVSVSDSAKPAHQASGSFTIPAV